MVRRPDPWIGRGDPVGQIKGTAAHALDGLIFSGEQWGYVDDDGNIRQRDGVLFKGRIIGKLRGTNRQAALGYYLLRFHKIEEQAAAIERDAADPKSSHRAQGRVRRMLEWVPQAEALGDFDSLLNRLRNLERRLDHAIAAERQAHRARKEQLIERAERLAGSRDWKESAAALRGLQEAWKAAGSAGRDQDDRLWERFRAAQDRFSSRRTEHFEQQKREREHNRRRKEGLCQQAEALGASADSRAATARIKELQSEWQAVGPVDQEIKDQLWARFRHACDRVFQHAAAERERRQGEWRAKMHDALSRKRDQADRLRESIAHDLSVIARRHETIDNLRPGSRADEIRSSLHHKIAEVSEKVAAKRGRLHDLEQAIADIRSKLAG